MPRAHVARTDLPFVRFKSRLPAIMVELSTQSGLANKEIADQIEETAKQRVPIESGDLKEAIHIGFRGDVDWAVVAGDNDAWYGHFVEFGTSRAPAHPFLVPAAEEQIPHISATYRKRYMALSRYSALR